MVEGKDLGVEELKRMRNFTKLTFTFLGSVFHPDDLVIPQFPDARTAGTLSLAFGLGKRLSMGNLWQEPWILFVSRTGWWYRQKVDARKGCAGKMWARLSSALPGKPQLSSDLPDTAGCRGFSG